MNTVMSKIAAIPAILLALAGWALIASSAVAMLSGPYEGRTCQTECVQWLFFSGTGSAVLGLILGIIGLRLAQGYRLSQVALWIAGPLCAIVLTIVLIGNLA
ncbi:hypothetical protein GWK36_02740 [Caldichromatium japonicum]|uniref:Uncharacterized protein n=1 Tax=Caldichromatium japonicum TaxID=2699430 RepID=A0A6G7VBC7_9GAMM|nr:hypothetical protein [Caldichromatium japonicum]QIK37097.1 hypothetical protein GWK36_02740 [Caldichromatium japonicum]